MITGTYNAGLVSLSILIAIVASYAAFNLGERVSASGGQRRWAWLTGGAVAMGFAIWSMHYVGMLAFVLPVPVVYHVITVILSLVAAVAGAAIALYMVSKKIMRPVDTAIAGVCLGGAIASMHYIGMAAMRSPAMHHYKAGLVALSVVIAITFASLAAWLAFKLGRSHQGFTWTKIAAASLMGVGIASMHYTAMAAAYFMPGNTPLIRHTVEVSTLGAFGIGTTTLLLLGTVLVTMWFDRRLANERLLRHLYSDLQEREARIRRLIDANIIGIFIWNLDNIVEGNEAFLHMLNYSREDLVTGRLHWSDLTPTEFCDRHQRAVAEMKATGFVQPYEQEYIRRDGGRVPVLVGAAIFQGSGNEGVAFVLDLSEQKHAESLLSAEKRILEMVAKGDPLSEILDTLCRVVEQQAGSGLASILLLDGVCLRHGGAPSLPKAYTEAIDGAVIGPSAGSCGTAAYRGEQVIVKDIATDPLWADYRDLALPHSLRACWSTPVFSSQGRVIATFAMYYREPRSPSSRDQEIIEQITHLAGVAIERKLTQEQLQRSEAYLAEAQRLTYTGSWALAPVTRKTNYWSEEMYSIWGFDPQQGLPAPEAAWQRIHPEDRRRLQELLGHVNRGEVKVDVVQDFRVVLPDGMIKFIHGVCHPVFDQSGDVIEYVGTAVDVTQRKRAEEERERLRQLELDLAHINRVSMMGELAASLGHEIKQPIAAAITNANTCVRWLGRDQPDVKEAREAASRMVKDATRAVEIMNRTSLLYKKGALQRELVNLNELINEITALLTNEASRWNVSILSELAPDLPRVMGDRVQLQQVLMNLTINAIDAMRGVDRARELTLCSKRERNNEVMVCVSDTGPGLPPEMDRIFDAFFTTKPHGTGMGLAISRAIVESHGGRLSATSNSGHGATFYFALPAEAENVVSKAS